MTERPHPKLAEEDIAALAATAKAPESLHQRIEAMLVPDSAQAGRGASRPSRGLGQSRRFPTLNGLRIGFATVGALGLIAAVVAVGLTATGSHRSGASSLNVQQAAALTLSAATGPAPPENRRDRSQLLVAVDGVPFPYWKERFGWRGIGTRSDVVAGRTVTTVFYANSAGRRVGYAIASGRAPRTAGGTVVRRWGVSYRVLERDGATVVTWQRSGHLCVMAGRGMSARTLVNLASWGSEKSRAA